MDADKHTTEHIIIVIKYIRDEKNSKSFQETKGGQKVQVTQNNGNNSIGLQNSKGHKASFTLHCTFSQQVTQLCAPPMQQGTYREEDGATINLEERQREVQKYIYATGQESTQPQMVQSPTSERRSQRRTKPFLRAESNRTSNYYSLSWLIKIGSISMY